VSDLGRLLWGSVIDRPYVVAFLACFVAFALRQLGWRRALTFAVPTWAIAFAAEYSSTRNGFPFGPYAYDEATRARELWISNVPSWDTVSFVFLSYFSLVLAAAVRTPPAARTAAPWPALRAPGTALLGGALMTLLDVVIDPVTLQGERWFLGRIYAYPWHGFYFGVTAANFAGWLAVGVATQWTFQRLLGAPWCRGPWRPTGPRFAWAALGVYAGVLAFMLAVTVAIGDLALAAASLAVSAATVAWLVRGLRGPRRGAVVVCAATRAEAAACRRGLAGAGVEGVEVLCTGVGPARAAAALAGRLGEAPRPALIVSSGFAGAAGPGLARHALVTAGDLRAPGPGGAPVAAALRLAPGARRCTVLAADGVAIAGALPAAPTVESGPVTVDMESAALAAAAGAAGIPLAVLRVVTDTPEAPFPPFVPDLTAALAARGVRMRLAHGVRALAVAARHPRAALAFVRASLASCRVLRDGWRAAGPSLARGWPPPTPGMAPATGAA
jgi:putative membrane protein